MKLANAHERIRVSNTADELARINPELLAHVFTRYPELEEKCRKALRLARKETET
jgi:hypothetical protein